MMCRQHIETPTYQTKRAHHGITTGTSLQQIISTVVVITPILGTVICRKELPAHKHAWERLRRDNGMHC